MESSTSSYSFFLFRSFQVLLHHAFGFKSLSLMKEQLAGLPLPASPASKCSVRLESTVWDPGTAGRVRRSFFTHQRRAADAKPQANNSPTGNQKIDWAAQVFNYCLKLEVTGGKKARVQPISCCWVQVSSGVTCILVMLKRNRFSHACPTQISPFSWPQAACMTTWRTLQWASFCSLDESWSIWKWLWCHRWSLTFGSIILPQLKFPPDDAQSDVVTSCTDVTAGSAAAPTMLVLSMVLRFVWSID